jgi:hypothetical protein
MRISDPREGTQRGNGDCNVRGNTHGKDSVMTNISISKRINDL